MSIKEIRVLSHARISSLSSAESTGFTTEIPELEFQFCQRHDFAQDISPKPLFAHLQNGNVTISLTAR